MNIKVLTVNGNQIQITDGNTTKIVSREQLESAIASKKVSISTLKVKCLDKQRDKNNNITAYLLTDEQSKQMTVTPQQLKNAMFNYQVDCINLTLTSDGRLVDTSDKCKYTDNNENVIKITIDEAVKDKNNSILYYIVSSEDTRYSRVKISKEQLYKNIREHKIICSNRILSYKDKVIIDAESLVGSLSLKEKMKVCQGVHIFSTDSLRGRQVNAEDIKYGPVSTKQIYFIRTTDKWKYDASKGFNMSGIDCYGKNAERIAKTGVPLMWLRTEGSNDEIRLELEFMVCLDGNDVVLLLFEAHDGNTIESDKLYKCCKINSNNIENNIRKTIINILCERRRTLVETEWIRLSFTSRQMGEYLEYLGE